MAMGSLRTTPTCPDNKNLVFGFGDRVSLFVSIYPSNHRKKIYISARRDVKSSWELLMAGQKATKAAETLKKCRKSPRPLLNGKEKVMKNIQPKPLRPLSHTGRRPSPVSRQRKGVPGKGADGSCIFPLALSLSWSWL